jgi:hypothetical protein
MSIPHIASRFPTAKIPTSREIATEGILTTLFFWLISANVADKRDPLIAVVLLAFALSRGTIWLGGSVMRIIGALRRLVARFAAH